MQIFSWITLKRNIYHLSIKEFHYSIRSNDDIFFIWTGTEEQLTKSLKNTTPLSLNMKYTQTSIAFLDTEVSIKNKKLVHKIYQKRNDR